jgi:hypothetical protein
MYYDIDVQVKGVIYEDFVNYKKCSMLVAFPTCSFKCNADEQLAIILYCIADKISQLM